jgi:hypothetical protein
MPVMPSLSKHAYVPVTLRQAQCDKTKKPGYEARLLTYTEKTQKTLLIDPACQVELVET